MEELRKSINPNEAVALGAAFHAKILSGVGIEDATFKYVTPLSLGIRDYGGGMRIIVPRNTTIPINMSREFHTVLDNQTEALFKVHEGERPIAKENNFLGKFRLYGIPSAPKGFEKFRVEFNIDADGILTISAQHIGTNNKKQITIDNRSGRFSEEERDKMVEEAKYTRLRMRATRRQQMLSMHWKIMSTT